MGALRKSLSAKAAAGTLRPSRVKVAESPPLRRVPLAPAAFENDPEASDAWRRLGRVCVERRTLSKGDLAALEGAARALAVVGRLHAALGDADPLVPAARGGTTVNPLLAEARRWHATLAAWLKVLGLTPVSRGSADPLAPVAEKSAIDEVLGR